MTHNVNDDNTQAIQQALKDDTPQDNNCDEILLHKPSRSSLICSKFLFVILLSILVLLCGMIYIQLNPNGKL